MKFKDSEITSSGNEGVSIGLTVFLALRYASVASSMLPSSEVVKKVHKEWAAHRKIAVRMAEPAFSKRKETIFSQFATSMSMYLVFKRYPRSVLQQRSSFRDI